MTIEEKTTFRVRVGPRPLRLRMAWLAAVILVTVSSQPFSFAGAANEFLPPTNVSCACSNEVLTFQCIVDGGTATVWKGSTFSCDNNQITLLHSRFTDGTMGNCNDGAIIAESLNGENNRYTSRLRVNISNGLNNKTVMCIVNSETGMEIVGDTQLTVITDPTVQVPNGIRLTIVEQERLIFTWNAINTNCPSINYLASSNCTTWSCDTTTDTTTTICSGLQLPSVCTFTVQTEVCGQVGLPSEPIILTLRVPDIPMVKIIPVYSSAQKHLLRIKANITNDQDSFNITTTVFGSVTSYSISFNSGDPMMFGQNTSCVEDVCDYVVDVPSDLCQSSSDINVALSASNKLGQGASSDHTTIGCANRFVEVEYDRMTSSIMCQFLDETDTSIKSCSVTYGQCGQVPGQFGRLGNFSTIETPNIVYVKFPVDGDKLECYSVTASSDLFTVIVEYNTSEKGKGGVTAAVIVGIIIAVLVVAVSIIIILLITVFVTTRNKGNNKIDNGDDHNLVALNKTEQDNISLCHEEGGNRQTEAEETCNAVKVKPFEDKANSVIDVDDLSASERLKKNSYKLIKVTKDSELKEFIEEQKLEFKRGCAFYEFVHDFESISKDKGLVFSVKGQQDAIFNPCLSPKHPLYGFRVPKPKFGDVDALFVQSTGSGARHLPAGSKLLYKTEPQPSTSSKSGLKPILSSQFELTTLFSEVTMKQFCEDKQIPKDYSVFLELGICDTKNDYVGVILQDKKTEFLYTGPSALDMVKKYSDGEKLELDKWRVFVLYYKFEENMVLTPGTNILHQAPGYNNISTDDFHVLTLGESEKCTCISDFVKKKLSLSEFTNGHAFYEFKREEDLQYYKDVVNLPLSEEENKVVQSGIDRFYRIPGVLPALPQQKQEEGYIEQAVQIGYDWISWLYYGMSTVKVNPTNLKGCRVFIQSTSQGARCVKPGDTILYKKTV